MNPEDIEVRLQKLEEVTKLLINKKIYKNLYNEHKRLLNSQYSNILSSLKKELKKYESENKINLKRLILENLPLNEIHIDDYLKIISSILERNRITFNIIQIEIFLLKTGAIKNSKVWKSNIPDETLRNYLNVL